MPHISDAPHSQDVCLVYLTTSTTDEARAIGTSLVQERLAACANIIGGMESIYWWEGKLETTREGILILKTTHQQLPALTVRTKELHSYDTPCILALPILAGNAEYLQWIATSVSTL
jgi:periplasmic divalent cation tolerance protein